jgi:hypothetical protein
MTVKYANRMKLKVSVISLVFLLLLLFIFFKYDNVKSGQIVSPRISGLFYKTSSGLQGYTENGFFNYKEGDNLDLYLTAGNGSQFTLGTITAQPQITISMLSVAPRRTANVIRLLAMLDNTPDDFQHIAINQKRIEKNNFISELAKIDFYSLNLDTKHLNSDWPTETQALGYLSAPVSAQANSFNTDEILFTPINLMIKTFHIQLRNFKGELCFYDLSKDEQKDYFGPIGETTLKVTPTGIYEYQDIGDFFWGCNLQSGKFTTETQFHPINNFDQFEGIAGCAAKGCRRNDLTGFSIVNYHDGIEYKFSSVAINFDSKTNILTNKVQSLGPSDKITVPNRGEGIAFTVPLKYNKSIEFIGNWIETTYLDTGKTEQKCLFITKDSVHSQPVVNNGCEFKIEHDTSNVEGLYKDMWWLQKKGRQANLAQLNTPVKWTDSIGQPRYTTWEYLPAGEDWQAGLLFRFEQVMTEDAQGLQNMSTVKISEFRKQ